MIGRLTSPPVGLYLMGLALAAGALLGVRHLPADVVTDLGWSLPLPVVALLFAFGDFFVLHLHVRRQRRSVSLSEVPLVLSLFLASPLVLLSGRLVGAALALVLYRKQRGIKLALNLLMMSAEAVAAVLVFRALLRDGVDSGPWAWLAAYAAAMVASVLSHAMVSLIIAMHVRVLHAGDFLRATAGGAGAGLAVSTFGLLAESALRDDVRTAFLLVVVTTLLILGYRAYSSLSERHLALERLHRFGQVMAASPEVDEVLRSLLVQARELLRAESAEVTFLPDGDGGQGVRVRLLPDDRLERTVVEDLRATDPVSARVVDEAKPVLLQRGEDGGGAGQYLEQRGQREAVLVPLRGDVGVVGTLSVADRAGEAGTFETADVALLQNVGDSAAHALLKGRQMDELRQGALHDALTGLPNRVQIMEALGAACSAARPFTVFMLDLNGFKDVNDTLGHDRGDEVLCEVARRLRAALPAQALVGRLGGDEFVVVAEVEDAGAACELADRVVAAVTHVVVQDGDELPIGTALGYTVSPEHGDDPVELLRRADSAMYAGKRGRKGPQAWSGDGAVVPAPRTGDRRSPQGSRS